MVEPANRVGRISPLPYGVNHRYGYSGYGMWDAAVGRAYPDFVRPVEDAGLSAVRFPGGTIANLYHWKRAIGPVENRGPNVHGGSGEPLTNEFGPDEFGGFIEEVGAAGTMTVNFATGDAEEAADWVEYMTSPLEATRGAVRPGPKCGRPTVIPGHTTSRTGMSPTSRLSGARDTG